MHISISSSALPLYYHSFLKNISCYVKASALHSREGEELLVRLNGVGHELPVPEQCVGGHRGGEILRGFFVCDPDGFQGNAVLCGGFADGFSGRYMRVIPQSEVSATVKPL